MQIAEALDYAHLKGVVHRDLKPSNIMVLPDGTLEGDGLRDRARAALRRADRHRRLPGHAPTTSPRRRSRAKGADARSDLYSLGVVFYETLTGTRPFVADTPFAILQKH